MPKTAGGWVSLGFKIAGATVAASPAIAAVVSPINGDKMAIPRTLARNYTGFDPQAPEYGIQWNYTAQGIGAVVGGIVVAKLGSMLGRIIH